MSVIGQQGRSRHEAGSPASIGGQYARGAAPAATGDLAATLSARTDLSQAVSHLKALDDEAAAYRTRRRAAIAELIELDMRAHGTSETRFTVPAEDESESPSITAPGLGVSLDELGSADVIAVADLERTNGFGDAFYRLTPDSLAAKRAALTAAPSTRQDATERTAAIAGGIHMAYEQLARDAEAGLAMYAREIDHRAAGIAVFPDRDSEGLPFYSPRGLVDEQGEHLDSSERFVEDILEHDETGMRDLLVDLVRSDIVFEESLRRVIRFQS